MKFTEVPDPLDGERTVAVVPTPAPLVDAPWARQRFVTGRSISAVALSDEMDNRAGRARLLGQALRPGVVRGLEVEARLDRDGRRTVLTVMPGMGLCASGEDVVVPRAMITETEADTDDGQPMSALDLPFRASPSLLLPTVEQPTLRHALAAWDPGAAVVASEPIALAGLRPSAVAAIVDVDAFRSVDRMDLADLMGLDARFSVSETLLPAAFTGTSIPRPFLGVLVLEPVQVEELGAGGDPDDPCEVDPEAEPFLDRRYVDAARLAWYPMTAIVDDENELVSPEERIDWRTWYHAIFGDGVLSDAEIRNRAAWAIFDLDAQRSPAPMPWERNAVPVALVGFTPGGEIAWVDRSAVCRQAGRRQRGESVVGWAGEPAIWQSRVDQFHAQFAEMTVDPDERLHAHFRWLPPAGVLPRELYDFTRRRTLSFPDEWGVSAAPIPLHQLDEVFRNVSALDPFDLAERGDEVKLLVPVEQQHWDPRLLQVAAVSPDFHRALRAAEQRIEHVFQARGELRAKLATLYGAVGGEELVPVFPADEDPEYQHEWTIRTALWDSGSAMAILYTWGSFTTGAILPTEQDLRLAAIALNWAGPDLAEGEDAPAGTTTAALGDALVATGIRGPLVVVAMDPDSALEVEAGPGFELPAGWTHASMVNREDGIAIADDPVVYVVLGRLDTESLDRALAHAHGDPPWEGPPARPLVVLAADIADSAVEELDWHHRRHPEHLPLVCVLRGTDAASDAELLDVVALRLGAEERRPRVDDPELPETGEYARRENIGMVVATQFGVVVVDASGGDPAAVDARVKGIETQLEALGDGAIRERSLLERQRRVLSDVAAAIKVPDTTEPATGASNVLRTRLAANVIRRVQQVEDAGEVDPLSLATLAAPARVPPFGTVPTSAGLGSQVLGGLKNRLELLETPGSGAKVLSKPDEIDRMDTMGIGGLMAVLEEKINRADDVVDFGFLQIQALTFRIREYLLGRDDALAAAASPLLGDLADIIHRNSDPDALQAFFDSLKTAAEAGGEDDDSGNGGDGGFQLGSKWFAEALNLGVKSADIYTLIGGFNPVSPIEDLKIVNPVVDPLPDATQVFNVGGLIQFMDTTKFAGTLLAAPGIDTSEQPAGEVEIEQPTAPTGAPSGTMLGSFGVEGAPSGSTFVRVDADAAGINAGTTNLIRRREDSAMSHFEGRLLGMIGQPQSGTWGEPHAGMLGIAAPSFDFLTAPSYVYESKAQTSTITKVGSVGIATMVQSAKVMKALQPVDWSLRSSGIKERLLDSKAVSLRAEAFRLRGAITQSIASATLHIEGLPFPGFIKPQAQAAEGGETAPALPEAELRPLTEANVKEVLEGKHDVVNPKADVGDLVSDAVKSVETSAAMLRVLESRIREVRGALRLCVRAKVVLERQIEAAEKRHDVLDQALAEAKHDLTVTRALLAEERERVEATNTRRERVLAEEVPFVVFHRSREIELKDDLPVHDLEPVLHRWSVLANVFDSPAPAAPDELRDAVDLFRDAPARWLANLAGLLERIDQVRAARRALEHARLRAALRLAQRQLAPPATLKGLKGLPLVSGLVRTRRLGMVSRRSIAAEQSVEAITRLTWKQAQVQAAEVMTLDDIVTASDVPAYIPKRVSQELEWIYLAAANLYRELTLVEPRIRAEWARRLSELDRPIDLRDLSVLPYWAEVGQGSQTATPDPFRRRELQITVDWLFGRLGKTPDPEALALMIDLVRVCILLSAHAPVGQILAGHADEPTPIEPGRLLPIRIDASRLRVGMQALVTLRGVVEARGIVEDLGDGVATARLISAARPGIVIQKGDPVRFVEADAVPTESEAGRPALIQQAPALLQRMK